MNVREELRSAEGMLRRRYDLVERIGSEDTKAEAWNTFQSMLTCVKEVRKHSGRIMSVVDDDTAEVALSMRDVLWEAEECLKSAEANVLKWGYTQSETNNLRNLVFSL